MAFGSTISFDELYSKLSDDNIEHIAFWIGSTVSVDPPSCCGSVNKIRHGIISSLHSALDGHEELSLPILDLIEFFNDKLSYDDLPQICKNILDIPFEQFMACLHKANPRVTLEVTQQYAGTDATPNHHHEALALISKNLLSTNKIKSVTIFTTNYDNCIEKAFDKCGISSLELCQTGDIVTYKLEYNNKKIRIIKPHGCAKIEDSLIFASHQMGKLLKLNWEQDILNCIPDFDLLLFVGYGFVDPDLYGLLNSITKDCVVIRNEYPNFSGDDNSSLLGRNVLKNDFFQQIDCSETNLFLSNLINADKENAPSIFLDLMQKMDISFSGANKRPSANGKNHAQSKAIGDIISSMNHFQKAVFWSELMHSCCSKLGRRYFYSELTQIDNRQNNNLMLKAYLQTYGNENNWLGAIKACKDLKRNYSTQVDTAYINGYLSFAASFENRRLIAFAYCIITYLFPVKDINLFQEVLMFRKRFFVKAISRLYGKSKVWGKYIGLHYALRLYAKSVESSLRNFLMKDNETYNYPHVIGVLYMFDAEMQIIAMQKKKKNRKLIKETINNAQRWSSFFGRLSDALQADRLLGWYSLSIGDLDSAVYYFARGLKRALALPGEPSLTLKLGFNLLRTGSAMGRVNIANINSKKKDVNELEKQCHLLMQSAIASTPLTIIAEHILFCAGNDADIMKKRLIKDIDVINYPIIYF
jgi:SIR2-like protein